jgi:two-component system sensor histidine kinase TctE
MLALVRSSPQGALMDERQVVDLAGVLEDAASDQIDRAVSKSIDLGFETSMAKLDGSPWMLREMVANLIENAINYTQLGGNVTARCGSSAERSVFVEVEDNGPGITPSERERIFDRFYQVRAGGKEGSGLGLSIVKEVAERHGAEISVGAGANGIGTRIRVSFPALPAVQHRQPGLVS